MLLPKLFPKTDDGLYLVWKLPYLFTRTFVQRMWENYIITHFGRPFCYRNFYLSLHSLCIGPYSNLSVREGSKVMTIQKLLRRVVRMRQWGTMYAQGHLCMLLWSDRGLHCDIKRNFKTVIISTFLFKNLIYLVFISWLLVSMEMEME